MQTKIVGSVVICEIAARLNRTLCEKCLTTHHYRVIAMHEQARRDSAWLRQASVHYANDARRRITARVAKRKG